MESIFSFSNRKAFFYFKIFHHNSKVGLCPFWWPQKQAIRRNLLAIQNEAISLVSMRSKELWLVQESHTTVKHRKSILVKWKLTVKLNRIKLRNVQNLKKMLNSQVIFCHKGQASEPKSLNVVLNIARVDTCGYGQHWRPFDSSFGWGEC